MFNIFITGKNQEQRCARTIYELLMSRQAVNKKQLLAACAGLPLDTFEDIPISHLPPRFYQYEETRRCMDSVIKKVILAINEKVKGGVIDNGEKKGVIYQYVGIPDDPLREQLNAVAIKDIQRYWNFCVDSSGFFPTSWVEHFFKDSMTLLDIKGKKSSASPIIKTGFDNNRQKNIHLLPILYDAIKQRRVIKFSYKPFVDPEQIRTIHPHYLHEYDGRWNLFGHEENAEWEVANVALDRIVGDISYVNDLKYIPAQPGFYKDMFSHLVGITKGIVDDNGKVPPDEDTSIKYVRVRTHTRNIHGLITTKKIHPDQKTIVEFGQNDTGEYGEVEIPVILNREFFGRILQLGHGLEIVAPEDVRLKMKAFVSKLWRIYE